MRVYFFYDEEKSKPLFEKSMKEILYLNGDLAKASEEYIPVAEEELFEFTLRQQNPEQYCLYMVYKIVHYLEIISGVRVRKLVAEFVKDSAGVYWLIDVFKLDYKELGTKKEEGAASKISIEGSLQQIGNSESKIDVVPILPERVAMVGSIGKKNYEKLRNKLNLNNQAIQRKLQEEEDSENTFSYLYPESDFTLRDLQKNHVGADKMGALLRDNLNSKRMPRPHSLSKIENKGAGVSNNQAGSNKISASLKSMPAFNHDSPISKTNDLKSKRSLLHSSQSTPKLKLTLVSPHKSSLNLKNQSPGILDTKTLVKQSPLLTKATPIEFRTPAISLKSHTPETIFARRSSGEPMIRPNTQQFGKRSSLATLSMKGGLVLQSSPSNK